MYIYNIYIYFKFNTTDYDQFCGLFATLIWSQSNNHVVNIYVYIYVYISRILYSHIIFASFCCIVIFRIYSTYIYTNYFLFKNTPFTCRVHLCGWNCQVLAFYGKKCSRTLCPRRRPETTIAGNILWPCEWLYLLVSWFILTKQICTSYHIISYHIHMM